MKDIANRYNARVALVNKGVRKHNDQLFERWQAGEIDADEVKAELQNYLAKATGKFCGRFARRWLYRFKWTKRNFTAPGEYLPYDHPKMQQFRERLSCDSCHPAPCILRDVCVEPSALSFFRGRTVFSAATEPGWDGTVLCSTGRCGAARDGVRRFGAARGGVGQHGTVWGSTVTVHIACGQAGLQVTLEVPQDSRTYWSQVGHGFVHRPHLEIEVQRVQDNALEIQAQCEPAAQRCYTSTTQGG